ncbi:unnamed protein product, partial [Rotaria magnacalcarata]
MTPNIDAFQYSSKAA